MSAVPVKDIQGLPVVLRIQDIQDILGLSKPKTYELAHTQDFPLIRFGRAMRVPRDAFLRWLDQQVGVEE